MLACRRVSSDGASMGSSALPILHALKNKGPFSRIWYIQPSKGTHRRIRLMNLQCGDPASYFSSFMNPS
jgi:hypothetical protein